MRRVIIMKISGIIFLTLGLCLTLLSVVFAFTNNKGISGIVDCTGPSVIQFISIVASLLILAGIVCRLIEKNQEDDQVSILIVVVLLLFLAVNAVRYVQAYRWQQQQPNRVEKCDYLLILDNA